MQLFLTPTGLQVGRLRIPCTIGRAGLTSRKREGDGGTPKGRHRIRGCFYRPDRMSAPNGWARPIRPRHIWSDDPGQPDYNHLGEAPYDGSHERMWRADPLYDLVLLLDWNWPDALPGRGSAIFIHRWRRAGYPTEGCIAMAPEPLHWLAERMQPGTDVHI